MTRLSARKASNGVHFVREGRGGVAFVLSHDQIALLQALLEGGPASDLGPVLGMPPRRQGRQQGSGRTAAQRAALSRSLRRLELQGLIERRHSRRLTAEGQALTSWLLETIPSLGLPRPVN